MFDVLVLLDCQLGDFQVAMTGGFWVAIRVINVAEGHYFGLRRNGLLKD
jgi:hypothetical protein